MQKTIQTIDLFGLTHNIPVKARPLVKVYSHPDTHKGIGIFKPNIDKRRWCIAVRPNSLISYFSHSHRQKSQHRKPVFLRKRDSGTLSPNATRKLQKSIKWLSWSSSDKGQLNKWKVNLLTLSFKENLEDDCLARKILSKWLEMAKYRFNLQNYVWRAEAQERGAIHFHVVCNVYLPWKEVQFTWNRICGKHGLSQPNANSTDVHRIKKVDNIASYLVKYLTDESDNGKRRAIKGRLWGCSHALSQAGKETQIIDNDELQFLQHDLRKFSLASKLIKEGKRLPDILKHCDIWQFPEGYYPSLPECILKFLWQTEIQKLNKPPKHLLEFWPRNE